jgi:transposase-like protein
MAGKTNEGKGGNGPIRRMLSLFGTGGWLVAITLLFAVSWAFYYRGTLRVLPFEGSDGGRSALRFRQALDNVALGATTGMDLEDPALQCANDAGPPQFGVPGTGLTVASIIGFVQQGPLAETQVRAAVVEHNNMQQMWLQVQGPGVKARAIGTRPDTDPDKMFLEAAESLYGAVRPVVLAYYLSTRDGPRCLGVVREILADSPDGQTEAAAYRIWGIVLRSDGDYPAAREKLNKAIEVAKNSGRGSRLAARAYLDLGHTYLWEERWDDAIRAYKRAIVQDRAWSVPWTFWGDARAGRGEVARGDIEGALRRYKHAIGFDKTSVGPWFGKARVFAGQHQYQNALDAYMSARRLQLSHDHTAALIDYGLGDALFSLGCDESAGEAYDHGAAIDSRLGEDRYDWQPRQACLVSRSPEPPAASPPPWRPGRHPIPPRGALPCASSSQHAPVSSLAAPGLEATPTTATREVPASEQAWPPQRRANLVLSILRRETSVTEAARKNGLTVDEIRAWRERFLAGGEGALGANMDQQGPPKDEQIAKLQQKVGELVLALDGSREVTKSCPTGSRAAAE